MPCSVLRLNVLYFKEKRLNKFKIRQPNESTFDSKFLCWHYRKSAGNKFKMEVPETLLKPPDEFLFPFTPYSIQTDFMRNLYEALEGKKLGIFESPTGTGKSMSLICGSIRWLFDTQQRLKDDVIFNIKVLDEELKKSTSGANWLDEHAMQAKDRQKRDSLQTFLNEIASMEERIEGIKEKAKKISEKAKEVNKLKASKLALSKGVDSNKLKSSNLQSDDEEDISDILLDDYDADRCLCDDDKSSESEREGEENKNYHGIKVFLCSRTHSQLSQLVREVQKSPYKDLQVRVASLASRQNYCINESVLSLKYLPLINEKCQELHNKKKGKVTKSSAKGESLKRQKTTRGCPFYQQSNVEKVKLKVLTEIGDIEQLLHWGKELNGCPYYASRHSIDEAQLILVPYNTILHKSTRQACGINLKNSVVIIDEAHNLLDAIGNIHSCQVTGLQLAQSYSQLVQYRDKYNERFSAVNLLHLNQLIFVVNKLLKKVGGKGGVDPNTPSTQPKPGVAIEAITEFVLSCEIDTINFYKLLEFVTKSKIVNKLQGFVCKFGPSVVIRKEENRKGVSAFLKSLSSKEVKPEEDKIEESENVSGNPLLTVVSFIQSLTNHCLDGRIVSNQSKTVGTSSLKYILLNPATHFTDIVREARSVILAGGTMQPISEFTDQLFYLAGGTPDRISVFTCGHIIPESNILPVIVSSGPSGRTFDFSYQHRNSTDVQDELGRLLINVCNVVPAGVVCFFPSYDYENLMYQRLEKTKVIEKLGNKKKKWPSYDPIRENYLKEFNNEEVSATKKLVSLLSNLNHAKIRKIKDFMNEASKVLREPKKSNKVDEVLRDYAAAVQTQGALLFSVVGGKLSEGLNFSDDLGRCVIVVGLPYPNLTSLELKEKMNYLDAEVGPTAGKTYYENLCMKAVNQSIGRSVRHKNDYASVLLVDHRYSRTQCVKALPEWIQRCVRKEENFGRIVGLLARFFAGKRNPT